jgi:hypothetical protein
MHDDYQQKRLKSLNKVPQSQPSFQTWIDRSANASLEDAAVLWLDIAKNPNTSAIEEQTDIQTFLNTIWSNTQHIFGLLPFKSIVESAFSSNNFIVLNFFLEKDAQCLCQTLRLMSNSRGIGNPLQNLFKKAVQNNEVYFVEHSLPYVPRTDERGHNFLHKHIWVAAQNAFDRSEFNGFDDPLFSALWTGSSDTCKTFARDLALQECADVSHSIVRSKALQLIEESLNKDQNARINHEVALQDHLDAQRTPSRKM